MRELKAASCSTIVARTLSLVGTFTALDASTGDSVQEVDRRVDRMRVQPHNIYALVALLAV